MTQCQLCGTTEAPKYTVRPNKPDEVCPSCWNKKLTDLEKVSKDLHNWLKNQIKMARDVHTGSEEETSYWNGKEIAFGDVQQWLNDQGLTHNQIADMIETR